ncbi:MAG: hypothetical protein GX868_10565 [Actinobacteria bacterium]|nr:hypothetical protein [Actinomycetota bacterium]
MTRCLGTYLIKMDDKGRLFVPAVYRDEFRDGAKLVFRKDFIALYAEEAFDEFMTKLEEKLAEGSISRSLYTRVTRVTELASADAQGRVVVPKKMRDALGIGAGDISLKGHGDYFAIGPRIEEEGELDAAYDVAGETSDELDGLGM